MAVASLLIDENALPIAMALGPMEMLRNFAAEVPVLEISAYIFPERDIIIIMIINTFTLFTMHPFI